MTLLVPVFVFGAYARVDGVFALVAGIRGSSGRRWVLLIEGAFSVLAGVVTLVWLCIPRSRCSVRNSLLGDLTGVAEVVAAVSLRRELQGESALHMTVARRTETPHDT